MSSREMLEAVGRALVLPPRTVLAGDARVLLLVLPVGAVQNLQLRWRIFFRENTFFNVVLYLQLDFRCCLKCLINILSQRLSLLNKYHK